MLKSRNGVLRVALANSFILSIFGTVLRHVTDDLHRHCHSQTVVISSSLAGSEWARHFVLFLEVLVLAQVLYTLKVHSPMAVLFTLQLHTVRQFLEIEAILF